MNVGKEELSKSLQPPEDPFQTGKEPNASIYIYIY